MKSEIKKSLKPLIESIIRETKELPQSPFFVEGKSGELTSKLKEYGIVPSSGRYYKTSDGQKVEAFMAKEGNKSGWKIHIVNPKVDARFKHHRQND